MIIKSKHLIPIIILCSLMAGGYSSAKSRDKKVIAPKNDKNQSAKNQPNIVVGSVIDKNGEPVEGCDVYILRLVSDTVIWEINKKKEFLNPHAITDKKGVFSIEIPRQLIPDTAQPSVPPADSNNSENWFALAISPKGAQPKLAADKSGGKLKFTVSEKVKKLDLGAFKIDTLVEQDLRAVKINE